MIYDRNGNLLNFIKNADLTVSKENAYYEILINISGENYYRYWFYTNAIEDFIEAIGGENILMNNEVFTEDLNTDDLNSITSTVETYPESIENTAEPVIENTIKTNN